MMRYLFTRYGGLLASIGAVATVLMPSLALAQTAQPPAEISNFIKAINGVVLTIAVSLSSLGGVRIWWSFRNNDPDAWRTLTNNIIGIAVMLAFAIIVAWISGFFGGGIRL